MFSIFELRFNLKHRKIADISSSVSNMDEELIFIYRIKTKINVRLLLLYFPIRTILSNPHHFPPVLTTTRIAGVFKTLIVTTVEKEDHWANSFTDATLPPT